MIPSRVDVVSTQLALTCLKLAGVQSHIGNPACLDCLFARFIRANERIIRFLAGLDGNYASVFGLLRLVIRSLLFDIRFLFSG